MDTGYTPGPVSPNLSQQHGQRGERSSLFCAWSEKAQMLFLDGVKDRWNWISYAVSLG